MCKGKVPHTPPDYTLRKFYELQAEIMYTVAYIQANGGYRQGVKPYTGKGYEQIWGGGTLSTGLHYSSYAVGDRGRGGNAEAGNMRILYDWETGDWWFTADHYDNVVRIDAAGAPYRAGGTGAGMEYGNRGECCTDGAGGSGGGLHL